MSIEYTFPLRGANFRPESAKAVTAVLQINDTVQLVAEPDNPYDANAIRVVVFDEHIGYVAREIAEVMIDDFNNADTFTCTVEYFTDPLTPVFIVNLHDIGEPDEDAFDEDEAIENDAIAAADEALVDAIVDEQTATSKKGSA